MPGRIFMTPRSANGVEKRFQLSRSSGRRHVCQECIGDESHEARVQRAVGKDEQFRADHEKLKEYGYRWKRRPVRPGPDPDFVWVLTDAHGRVVAKEQALSAIGELEAPEMGPEDFDYF